MDSSSSRRPVRSKWGRMTWLYLSADTTAPGRRRPAAPHRPSFSLPLTLSFLCSIMTSASRQIVQAASVLQSHRQKCGSCCARSIQDRPPTASSSRRPFTNSPYRAAKVSPGPALSQTNSELLPGIMIVPILIEREGAEITLRRFWKSVHIKDEANGAFRTNV